ncbi:MAG: TonB-dependent receptor domain-containing protein [Cyclobacteriaceae bacterium]
MKTTSHISLRLVCLFLFAGIQVVQAQRPGGDAPKIGIISGKILDNDTGTGLEFSNVGLYNQRDSSLVTGAITDAKGSFKLQDLPFGKFYLEVNFIGYDKQTVRDIQLTPQNSQVNLGEVRAGSSLVQLEGVEVTAERSRVEFHLDKRVINVSQDLNAAGGTAVDVLENTPGVTVDIDGNVALRGSSSFTVFIDGKPSVLKGSDALQQLPASMIQNIEIVTNPSAKYDPDGMAGIINIVMKKNALSGMSGIINASVGTRDKYRTDFLLNYKMNKWSLFAGLDFSDQRYWGSGSSSRLNTLRDTVFTIDSESSRVMHREGMVFKAGAEYSLSDNTSLSLEGNIGSWGFGRQSNSRITEFSQPGTGESDYSITKTRAPFYGEYYSMNTSFDHRFAKPGQKISALFFFSDERGGSENFQNIFASDASWNVIGFEPDRQNTFTNTNGINTRFQTDYEMAVFEKAKFETGYQMRYEKNFQNFVLQQLDNETGGWIDNPEFSNDMDFEEHIQSIYSTFSSEFKGLKYQAGLRGEYTYRQVSQQSLESPFELDMCNLFPTLHFSKDVGKDHQFQLSYSKRINRPRNWDLNPFPSFSDQFTIRQGNPMLRPEFVDSYEFGYQKRMGVSFLSMQSYYRITTDMITRINELRPDGITVMTAENINNDYSLGAELMLNYEFSKWFLLNTSANIYNYRIEGVLSDDIVNRSSNNYDFRINGTFKLKTDTRFQVNTIYNGPSVTAQGSREAFYFTTASVRHDFFNKKIAATAQLRDIFGTMRYRFTNEGNGFVNKMEMQREPRVFTLTLSYKINNYKRNSGGRDQDDGGGGSFNMDM